VSVPTELLVIGVGVDTTAVEEGLAGLGPIADDAAAGLGDSFGAAAEGLNSVGTQAQGASRGMSGLAGAVGLVNPALGKSIRQVATMTRSLQALKIGLGPVGVALAAVTAAYVLVTREMDKRKESAERAERVVGVLTSSELRLADAYADLQTEIGGTISREEDLARVRQAAFISSRPEIQEITSAIGEQILEVERLSDRMEVYGRDTVLNFKGAGGELAEQTAELEKMRASRDLLIDNLREEVGVRSEGVNVRHDETEAAEALRESEKSRAIATANSAAALAEFGQMSAEVAAIEAEGAASVRSEVEALQFALEQKLLTLKEIQTVSGGSIEIEVAREAAQLQFETELATLQDKFAVEARARRAGEDAEDDARAAKQATERDEAFNDAANIAGSLSELAARAAADKVGTNRRAAQAILATSKALAVAEAGASLRAGIQAALARTATRPIASALAVAAQLAGFATNVAAIRAQSLHQGGRLAPDEQRRGRATILASERVLSPEASRRLGEEGARQLERGEQPRPRDRGGGSNVFQHFGLYFDGVIEGPAGTLHNYVEQDRDTGRRRAY